MSETESKTCKTKGCRKAGRPETDGYCFECYQESKGIEEGKVRVSFTKNYKNGMIPVNAKEKEVLELTFGQVQQIKRDDPYAVVVEG